MFNWVAEAKKFTPDLKVVALHGAGRHERFEEIAQCNLVMTSYALIRRDAERYHELEFDTLVLDEAQHTKNRQTQNALAVADMIEFCYLDGATTNRGAVVEKFQGNANIPVFLISLKAGGVGLTLTGADTVVHFDPWLEPGGRGPGYRP